MPWTLTKSQHIGSYLVLLINIKRNLFLPFNLFGQIDLAVSFVCLLFPPHFIVEHLHSSSLGVILDKFCSLTASVLSYKVNFLLLFFFFPSYKAIVFANFGQLIIVWNVGGRGELPLPLSPLVVNLHLFLLVVFLLTHPDLCLLSLLMLWCMWFSILLSALQSWELCDGKLWLNDCAGSPVLISI